MVSIVGTCETFEHQSHLRHICSRNGAETSGFAMSNVQLLIGYHLLSLVVGNQQRLMIKVLRQKIQHPGPGAVGYQLHHVTDKSEV